MIEEAEELFAEGQLAEGVAVLRDCIATQSGCSEAHFLLAELYETGELEAGEDAQGEGEGGPDQDRGRQQQREGHPSPDRLRRGIRFGHAFKEHGR